MFYKNKSMKWRYKDWRFNYRYLIEVIDLYVTIIIYRLILKIWIYKCIDKRLAIREKLNKLSVNKKNKTYNIFSLEDKDRIIKSLR
jgi:hypothetical protein